MVAFLLFFIYNDDLYEKWKFLYPFANAFLCCVQPWTCTIFNKDVQNRLRRAVGCDPNDMNSSTIFVSSASVMINAK
ncbi:unnamed protein product [Cylicocyclus nassatus]|uniref:Uncharacterized protein n=1 Tax=Cylicocyclus nassatus TaxID=53992 RepID=A0AA36M778_CYLNA|nr:unnamed protein product [Cylicocyclus nassatus]